MVLTVICVRFCYTLQSTAPIPTTFIAMSSTVLPPRATEVQILNFADVRRQSIYIYVTLERNAASEGCVHP